VWLNVLSRRVLSKEFLGLERLSRRPDPVLAVLARARASLWRASLWTWPVLHVTTRVGSGLPPRASSRAGRRALSVRRRSPPLTSRRGAVPARGVRCGSSKRDPPPVYKKGPV
jgi:hypothetical protein